MVNQHGINISYELGHEINKALFEGDTNLLFSLLAGYLRDNNLEAPEAVGTTLDPEKYDDTYKSASGTLMR